MCCCHSNNANKNVFRGEGVTTQLYSLIAAYFFSFYACNEQSNRTPRCSREVSAAGLPWLKHSRVQWYT